MNQIPQLLIENGNYTSLADLTLRKIKALEGLTKEERDRLLGELEYRNSIEQCYSVIISLFVAIDQSLLKDEAKFQSENHHEQNLIQFFLSKLRVIQNNDLKIQLREKILRRIEMFNDEVVMTALFDYLIGQPQTLLDVGNLPQLSTKTLNKLVDNLFKADTIKQVKFDSIIKILMKRDNVEKLCLIVINTC